MQCFVHFDHQKMLDAIAVGVFHLVVTSQYVFQVHCLFTNTKYAAAVQ